MTSYMEGSPLRELYLHAEEDDRVDATHLLTDHEDEGDDEGLQEIRLREQVGEVG